LLLVFARGLKGEGSTDRTRGTRLQEKEERPPAAEEEDADVDVEGRDEEEARAEIRGFWGRGAERRGRGRSWCGGLGGNDLLKDIEVRGATSEVRKGGSTAKGFLEDDEEMAAEEVAVVSKVDACVDG
jgi:hypothetical protein